MDEHQIHVAGREACLHEGKVVLLLSFSFMLNEGATMRRISKRISDDFDKIMMDDIFFIGLLWVSISNLCL